MRLDPNRDGINLTLDAKEAELLRLALKRATFEDTPASTLKDVVDFAYELLAKLGDRERPA